MENHDRALVLGFRDNDRFTCAFYDDDLDSPMQYLDTTCGITGRVRWMRRPGAQAVSRWRAGSE